MQFAKDRQKWARELDEDSDFRRDEGRRSPAYLRQGPENVLALCWRDYRLQTADDLRRPFRDISGEQDIFHRSIEQSLPKASLVHHSVDSDDAANSEQGEAEAQLDGLELRRYDDDERVAIRERVYDAKG